MEARVSDDIMRLEVAKAHGFELGQTYTEKQVAGFLRKDASTLKRWRKRGYIPFKKMGPKLVHYVGSDLADFLLGKKGGEWENTQSGNSRSGNITYPSEREVPPTTGHSTTRKPSARDALASARKSIQKPQKRSPNTT
jgi:hypothetical protein